MRTPAALLSLVLVAGAALAGCYGPPVGASDAPASSAPAPSRPPPSSSPPAGSPEAASDLLVTVAYRGGHCRTGPCDRTLAVDREGGVNVVAPEPQDLGSLSPALFADLREQLSRADFERLGSRPFKGECPVNFDGQELIYTFHGATGDIRLASCEVELEPADPLFVAIDNALASVAGP